MSSTLFNRIICFSLILMTAFGCTNSIPEQVVQEISKLPDKIDYNYHVKPILSDKCFSCHGPDADKRKANLRLDFDKKQLPRNDAEVLTIDDVKSEIPNRLFSQDPEIQMPPPESHLSLSDTEKAKILRWTDQGAQYKPHWSFIPIEKNNAPIPPEVTWGENEIDYFVK